MGGVKMQVAVKTLAFTECDDFEEKLEEFKQEATIGWAVSSRSRSGVRTALPSEQRSPCPCLHRELLTSCLSTTARRRNRVCVPRLPSLTMRVRRG